MTIRRLSGLEILDSRGRPTVRATCELASGAVATRQRPQRRIDGRRPRLSSCAMAIRRYGGYGCRKAVANIDQELHHALAGRPTSRRKPTLIERWSRSMARGTNPAWERMLCSPCRWLLPARAIEQRVPLYQYFAELWGQPVGRNPILTINLFSGGKHAGGQVPIQDVLIVPRAAKTFDEALVTATAVYSQAVELVRRKYGMRWLVADEGGLAPPVDDAQQLLSDAVECITAAGYTPGREVALAVDVASSHFYHEGRYHLGQEPIPANELVNLLAGWVAQYPLISVEDGLAEDDWENWPRLRAALADRAWY